MATLDERVAYLEGRVEEHARSVDGISEALASLEGRMDRRFEAVDRRFEALEEKMSRQFMWLVGIQVTTLASVLAAFAATVTALVSR